MKHVLLGVNSLKYVKIPVENEKEELALLEALEKMNENTIASIEIKITQTDGTVHIGHADDWKIEDCEFDNEEE